MSPRAPDAVAALDATLTHQRKVIAAASLAGYFATRPEPLWTVVGWNIFFLLLNLWQLSRIVRVSRAAMTTDVPRA